MKKFMLIFTGTSYEDLGFSPEEMQNRMDRWFTWHEKMSAEGIIHSGEALHDSITRISGPDRVTTDNVAIESKELIGGYYVVSAADLDGAKKIAQDFPDYDLDSSVEIREVMEFDN